MRTVVWSTWLRMTGSRVAATEPAKPVPKRDPDTLPDLFLDPARGGRDQLAGRTGRAAALLRCRPRGVKPARREARDHRLLDAGGSPIGAGPQHRLTGRRDEEPESSGGRQAPWMVSTVGEMASTVFTRSSRALSSACSSSRDSAASVTASMSASRPAGTPWVRGSRSDGSITGTSYRHVVAESRPVLPRSAASRGRLIVSRPFASPLAACLLFARGPAA